MSFGQSSCLRILSFNIALLPQYMTNAGNKKDYKENRIKQFFTHFAHQYDILLLQEVWESIWQTGTDYSVLDQTCVLARHMFPYQHFQRRRWFQIINSGLIILSKFPLDNCHGQDFTSCCGIQRFISNGILSACVYPPNAPPIDLYNTHFHVGSLDTSLFNNPAAAATIQREQTIELRNYMQQHSYAPQNRYLLAGDFNICAIAKYDHGTQFTFVEFQHLLNLQQPSLLQQEDGTYLPTYPVPLDNKGSFLVNKKCWATIMCVDHVFTNLDHPQLKVLSLSANGLYLSDHCALDISIPFRV